jgi:hypothetical protein
MDVDPTTPGSANPNADADANAAATGSTAEVEELRRQTIKGLDDLINARGDYPASSHGIFSLEHDPILLRRADAVELLGYFPNQEAAAVLSDLLLRAERKIKDPPGAGRWLRDTALLTLLRSTRLPRASVNQALLRGYSFLRYLSPLRWGEVYDDLPVLGHYRKRWIFFVAFLLVPLLIFAIPTLILARQLVDPDSYTSNELRMYFVVYGVAIEIYLAHQVVIALLAGLYGPILRLPGGSRPVWKAIVATVLALISGALVLTGRQIIESQCFTVGITNDGGEIYVSACSEQLWQIAWACPLLLLPVFILAHDLRQITRYTPKGEGIILRIMPFILQLVTLGIYFYLPQLVAAAARFKGNFRHVVLPYLAYLFAAPLVVAIALKLLTFTFGRFFRRPGTG